jgi:hypothetical protein
VFTSFFRLLPAAFPSAWARASGMYTWGGLPPCGWATIPTTVKLCPTIFTVEPTFSLLVLA